jgi:hypothetical protein
MNKKRDAKEKMTAEERTREEVRAIKSEKSLAEQYKSQCQGQYWQSTTRKKIAQVKKDKLAALDLDSASLVQQKEEIEGDARGLLYLVNTVDREGAPAEHLCPKVWKQIESWEKARAR